MGPDLSLCTIEPVLVARTPIQSTGRCGAICGRDLSARPASVAAGNVERNASGASGARKVAEGRSKQEPFAGSSRPLKLTGPSLHGRPAERDKYESFLETALEAEEFERTIELSEVDARVPHVPQVGTQDAQLEGLACVICLEEIPRRMAVRPCGEHALHVKCGVEWARACREGENARAHTQCPRPNAH